MSTSEIDVAHGLPRDIQTLTDELQQVLHDLGRQIMVNFSKPSSAQRYARRLIQRVNRNEEGAEVQKRKTRAGMINFRSGKGGSTIRETEDTGSRQELLVAAWRVREAQTSCGGRRMGAPSR